MLFILTLHSIVRWLTVLAAAALIIRFALGWFKKQPYDKTSNALAAAFGGTMDLQLTLGFIYFIWNGMMIDGGFALRHRWEHLVVMLAAVAVAHLPAMWKKKEDAIRYRNGLIAVVVSLLLVVVGVGLLPGNRWLGIAGLW